MIKFRTNCFHYLTEAFQIFTNILKWDSLLLLQQLKEQNN